MSGVDRLVRVHAQGHSTPVYATPILPAGTTDMGQATEARLLSSSEDIWSEANQVRSDTIVKIDRFAAPLAPQHTGTQRLLGLNYAAHAHESHMPIPAHPILFYKPVTALTGPFDDIVVPLVAQDPPTVDYECELIVVIGTAGKDIPEEAAQEYIYGYTVGNDVSHREWQLARGGTQWSLGKSFDTWAPYGPGIIAAHCVPDPGNLSIATKVNGRVVQESNTRDLIFSVPKLVSFLSRGTTLRRGDMIWTGTPPGVGMGRRPPLWLRDGDVVETSLQGVGRCVNRVRFERGSEARL